MADPDNGKTDAIKLKPKRKMLKRNKLVSNTSPKLSNLEKQNSENSGSMTGSEIEPEDSQTAIKSRYGRSRKPVMRREGSIPSDQKVAILARNPQNNSGKRPQTELSATGSSKPSSPVKKSEPSKSNNEDSPNSTLQQKIVTGIKRGKPRKNTEDIEATKNERSASEKMDVENSDDLDFQLEGPSTSKRARMISSKPSKKSVNGDKQSLDVGPSDDNYKSSLIASSTSNREDEDEEINVEDTDESDLDEAAARGEGRSDRGWSLGDVAWARLGGHPYWPCIISYDPHQKDFTKTSLRGTTVKRSLHVQFFADNGRRSWVSASSIIPFRGIVALNNLKEKVLSELKKKDKKLVSAFNVRHAVRTVWNEAVREAVFALRKPRTRRIQDFTRKFPIATTDGKKTAAQKSRDSQETETPRKKRKYTRRESTSVKIKQESDASPPADLNKPGKSTDTKPAMASPVVKKKYYKKRFTTTEDKRGARVYLKKFRDRVASDHPNLSEKAIKKYLLNDWERMDENQKAKFCILHFPDNVSDDSDTSHSEDDNDADCSDKSSP